MYSLNKIQLIGNLGRDPETKTTANGRPFCRFSVATTERWKDQAGQQQEKTEWHNIVVWGKLAEICGQHIRKGSRCYIEGQMKSREYEQNGEMKKIFEVNAKEMMFLDDKKPQQQTSGYDNRAYSQSPVERYGQPDDSDVPF